MGRRGPTGVIDTFQHALWYWYIHENHTFTETRVLFRQEFPHLDIYQRQPDFPSESTLRRAFLRWDYRKYLRHYDSQHLNRELWVYFYHWGLNDVEILMFLNSRNYPINARRYAVSQILIRFIAYMQIESQYANRIAV